MKITYTRKGDYLFPELELCETETRYIGKYGLLRKTYLKKHRSGWYQSMLLAGKLDSHLADAEEQAQQRLDVTVSQMMKAENVTEKLKTEEPFTWMQVVNSIYNRAEEIILSELIYV